MKTIATWLAMAGLGILAAGAANAADAPAGEPVNISEMTRGYTYFNRPGADMAAHDQDMVACAVEAARTRSIDDQINNGAGNGILGAVIGQAFGSAYNRAAFASALENCMVVKNWRVVVISDAEGKALLKQGNYAVREEVMRWVGSAEPHGQVVRVWNNDAARASTKRYEIRPGRKVDGSLSLVAIADVPYTPPPAAQIFDAPPRGVKLDKRWPTKVLKPNQLATAPADSAIVIVHVEGMSMRNGIGVTFMRTGPEGQLFPSSVDKGPDLLFAMVGLLGAKKEGKYMAFAVPSGRWRIAAMGIMPTVNFCLGAPAFDTKPGDVIFAGSFNMSSETLGPSLALDGVRTWLAGQPQAETVRAADYTNGWTINCGDNAIYALEIPGAPFVESYTWGGAYRPPAPTASPSPAAPTTPAG